MSSEQISNQHPKQNQPIKAAISANLVIAILKRPSLWITTLQATISLAPRRWWLRPPFLPIPDNQWVHFRSVTAYGGDGGDPLHPDDIITWLTWRKQFPN